jgi:hypothetical protein
MKRPLITIVVLMAGALFATVSVAQGRHDEKPHGAGKPAQAKESGTSAIPGRHDERPHGPPPAIKQTSKAEPVQTKKQQ